MVTPFCRRSAERRLTASEDTEYPTRRLRDRKYWRMSARQRRADRRTDSPGTIDRTTWASRTSIRMRGSTFAICPMWRFLEWCADTGASRDNKSPALAHATSQTVYQTGLGVEIDTPTTDIYTLSYRRSSDLDQAHVHPYTVTGS